MTAREFLQPSVRKSLSAAPVLTSAGKEQDLALQSFLMCLRPMAGALSSIHRISEASKRSLRPAQRARTRPVRLAPDERAESSPGQVQSRCLQWNDAAGLL